MELTQEEKDQIDGWVHKFPQGQQRSAVLMALRIVQARQGWLSDPMLEAVADYLDMPLIQVCEVASFYTMYHREPVGKHVVKVCSSLSCCLGGAYDVVAYLEKRLNVSLNATTPCGQVTLMETECLGACAGAPMMMINDEAYHEKLTPKTIDVLIDDLLAGANE